MSEFDYNQLLKPVQTETSNLDIEEHRFKIPKVDVFYEGNTTVLRNFDKILVVINRESSHLLKYFLGNVGTAGEIVGNRLIFQGKIPPATLQGKLEEYIGSYVICSECSRPDTHLVKKGRMMLLRCDACGAFRSIGSMKKRTVVSKPSEMLKEGQIYDLTIKDIGKRGDGVAYFEKYIVYVAGAVKGAVVKVKIEKISGSVAFGSVVQ